MNVLAIGDVCGKIGVEALLRLLPTLKKQYNIGLTIVNGENSAEGNGIVPQSADLIFKAGADVITGGNHTLRRPEFYSVLEENPCLLRPANLPAEVPGKGVTVVDLGFTRAAVLNLLGVVYLESQACPFQTADALIAELKEQGIANIFVDFHAEATSEKRALGFYLDGKVTAVFGTHTHVATADACVLPNGTGYITDLGMTGVELSVLGVEKEIIIQKMRNKMPVRFKNATGPAYLNGCVFKVDHKTGRCLLAQQITVR